MSDGRDSRNVGGWRKNRRRLLLGVVVGLLPLAVELAGMKCGIASGRPMPWSASADPLAHLPRVMLWAWSPASVHTALEEVKRWQ